MFFIRINQYQDSLGVLAAQSAKHLHHCAVEIHRSLLISFAGLCPMSEQSLILSNQN